jgi:hypothetical protein
MIDIKLTSRPRLVVPGLAPDQMRRVGELSHAEESARIARGLNASDEPAKPLAPRYAAEKKRAGRTPVRDLRFTGEMLNSRRVTEAGQNAVTVSFDDERQVAKAARNEQIEPMLGISPASAEKIDGSLRDEFAQSVRRADA